VQVFRRPSGWLLIASALFGGVLQGKGAASQTTPLAPASGAGATPRPQTQPVATEDEIKLRCGTCHKLPGPEILPRSAWRDEIVRMMLIQEGVPEPAGATGFLPLSPDWQRLWRYYDARAPERLPEPEAWPAASRAPVPFETRVVPGAAAAGAVAISNVRLHDVDGDKRLDVVASEMRTGPVLLGLARDGHALKPIARLSHPAHIEPVDLDKDGRGDFLVADLGSFQPADHSNGAVYWLRGRADGSFVTTPLATGLPRTSDARAADFDGDGDLDVIVGSFGWRTTGNVTLLENRTTNWKTPAFTAKLIDPRTGAIHVPTIDLNRDGKADFIVLLAQQHESVIAFVNTGKGLEFTPQVIYEAPHPNWGSSGIDLVDLDKDGDMDVLLTHGDTFDDFVLKPYHGIIWLENTGGFPFVAHHLASLPGAQRAQAADFDGDGDLDIAASAFVSGEATPRLASLVWLEQTAPGRFERHTLESGSPSHATLDVGDVDGDGKPDLVVGWFALGRSLGAWAHIWRNERK
jgi:hypothetical protein